MVCNPSNRYLLCCVAFKNICKLYHSLGLILDLACLTHNYVSAICLNKCRFILLLLLLYGILLYDFGKYHFPSYFDRHLVCLQLLVIRKKGWKAWSCIHTGIFSFVRCCHCLSQSLIQLLPSKQCTRMFISKASRSIKCCLHYVAGSDISVFSLHWLPLRFWPRLAILVTCVCLFFSYEMCVHILSPSFNIVFHCCLFLGCFYVV